MNIIEVNYTDLPGRIFNGYDLHLTLNQMGHVCNQIVKFKRSSDNSVKELESNSFLEYSLKYIEDMFSMNNLLNIRGKQLMDQDCFNNADIVHYHILHNNMISLLDLPELINKKPSVWTIHDPWMITGNCVYPLECSKWLDGCYKCCNLNYKYFEMKEDKASEMWKIKEKIYKQLDVDLIVSTEFMKKYIQHSPLTMNFKKIHKIPFGVKVEEFEKVNRIEIRKKYNIGINEFVIGFRNEESPIKGCKYIYEALKELEFHKDVVIITVGSAILSDDIKNKFKVIELGWQDNDLVMKEFFSLCNVFLMPSLAESFGLMAIEAMAAMSTVVCFKDTVLEEVTFAPECGVAVEYGDSIKLRNVVEHFIKYPEECTKRGIKGREVVKEYYQYKDYVMRHLNLYKEIMKNKETY